MDWWVKTVGNDFIGDMKILTPKNIKHKQFCSEWNYFAKTSKTIQYKVWII